MAGIHVVCILQIVHISTTNLSGQKYISSDMLNYVLMDILQV